MRVSARTELRHTTSIAPEPPLPVWARLADALTIAIVLLAAAVTLYGGGAGEIAGIRVSLRSAWRLPIWAAAIAILRHGLVRWRPLHRRVTHTFRRIMGRAEPLYPDVVGYVMFRALIVL